MSLVLKPTSNWYHKRSATKPGGSKLGETINFFGCQVTVKGIETKEGINFINLGPKWSSNCPGRGSGLNSDSFAKTPPSPPRGNTHPYLAFINGGNNWSPTEKKRIESGLRGCWNPQSTVVRDQFNKLSDNMALNDLVKANCTNPLAGLTRTFASAFSDDGKEGNSTVCMTGYQVTARKLEYLIKVDKYEGKGKNRKLVSRTPGKCYNELLNRDIILKSTLDQALRHEEIFKGTAFGLTIQQCKQTDSVPGCTSSPPRICNSNHAVGRAWDIFPLVSTYTFPDPYHPDNWNTCNFARWMFFAENSWIFNFNNISNEYWHWQYNSPLESKEQIKNAIAVSKSNDIKTEEATEETTQTTVADESTQNNTQVIDGQVNVDFEIEDYSGTFPQVEEYKYNSLESVKETLPPLSLERVEIQQIRGLKYLKDNDELLLIDRYTTAQQTTTNEQSESEFGNETDAAQNIKNNSSWENAPAIEQKDNIKKLIENLGNIQNQKSQITSDIEESKKILDQYRVIIGEYDEETSERISKEIEDKVQNLLKNSSGNVSESVKAILSNGKTPEQMVTELENNLDNSRNKLKNLEDSISSLEKEIQLKTIDEELSRESIQNRLSNYLQTSGVGGLFSSGSEEQSLIQNVLTGSLKEFDLYEVGDQLQKFDIKIKKLIPPKLSDLSTILSGGLSSKSLLSSLSSFGLPALEELDDIMQYADQAKSLYDGDLSSLTSTLGDIGALDAISSFESLKSLKESVGPIIEEGKSIYNEGKKLYDEGKAIADKAQAAYDEYQSLKQQAESAWKEGGRLWNQAKGEIDNLKNEANRLLEEAKNLPGTLRDAAIAKARELELEASNKIESLKKEGQDKLDAVKTEYNNLKTQSENLLNNGKKLLSDPKVLASNEAQSKLNMIQQEVDLIKESYSSEVISTIESAVDKKQSFETAINSVNSTQKAILSSKNKTKTTKESVKHFPKDFKSFYDWVLQKENEVLNIETVSELSGIETNSDYVSVNVEGSPSPSVLENENEISVRLDGNISTSVTSQQSQNNISPFIIYRGATGKIQNPNFSEMKSGRYRNFGFERIPTQYKSYFDFGKSQSNPVNLEKLFSGYVDSIMSPIDVALLLNAGNVGMFNNIAPYGFGEGSELAAAVTFQKVIQKDVGSLFSKGGIGTEKQPNWAYNPEWAGLYVNFLLEENGIYQSDDKFLDFKKIRQVDRYVKNGEGIKLKNTAPLTDIPKSFPGAVIGYFDQATRKGHIEIMLRATIGGFITLGGNIKIDGVSKFGSTHGFRFYYSLKEFSPSNDVYIIKRGVKNNWTTNGRLDGRIKRTSILNEYMSSIENSDSPKNTKLFAEAYNILRGNVSDSVYSRKNEVKLTENGKIELKDEMFKLHRYNDIYMSGSIDLNTYTFNSIYEKPFNNIDEPGGH